VSESAVWSELPEDGLLDFLQGYEPVSIKKTCEADPIGPDQLAVWVNRTGEWEQMDVDLLWEGKRDTESLCRRLVTNLLGMSAAQYESMKDAFEHAGTSERIGIYRKEEDGIMNYVIVVRMVPRDYKSLLKAGAAGAAGATAAVGTGALAYYLSQKGKKPGNESETFFSQNSFLGKNELRAKAVYDIASGVNIIRSTWK